MLFAVNEPFNEALSAPACHPLKEQDESMTRFSMMASFRLQNSPELFLSVLSILRPLMEWPLPWNSPLNATHVPLEKAPNGRVRLEEEKSRSAVTSMSVCKVLPLALLKRLMRSSAVVTGRVWQREAHRNDTKRSGRRWCGMWNAKTHQSLCVGGEKGKKGFFESQWCGKRHSQNQNTKNHSFSHISFKTITS